MLRYVMLLAMVAAASFINLTFGLGIFAGWVIGQFLRAVVRE